MTASDFPHRQNVAAFEKDFREAMAQRDYGRAEALAGNYSSQFPDEPHALECLVEAQFAAGKLDSAIQTLSSSVDRFPADPRFPYTMAVIQHHRGRSSVAQEHLRTVLKIAPQSPQANALLGQILLHAGRNEEAVPYLRTAQQLQPGNSRVAKHLGDALAQLGDFDAAEPFLAKHTDARTAAEIKEAISQQKKFRAKFVRWPEAAAELLDLPGAIRKHVLAGFDRKGTSIAGDMTVLTQGSCFARNLAVGFSRYNLDVHTIPFGEEHNNTFANKIVLEWLLHGVSDDKTRIVEESFGGERARTTYRAALAKADLYVFTLGVAAAFFNDATGEFAMPRMRHASTAALIRNNTFRTTTVQENVDNVSSIIAMVRQINPTAAIVLTVSPVPLSSTSEMPSAILADCVSKSTMRVCVHEILGRNLPGVLYWPSFEMVRWLSGHYGRLYGNDDGSTIHVDSSVVNLIVDTFIEMFGDGSLKAKT